MYKNAKAMCKRTVPVCLFSEEAKRGLFAYFVAKRGRFAYLLELTPLLCPLTLANT